MGRIEEKPAHIYAKRPARVDPAGLFAYKASYQYYDL
jgi:hypothetical protein